MTTTTWLSIARDDWNAGHPARTEAPDCPPGHMVLVALVDAGDGRSLVLPHPFPLDDCAHCAYEHLQPLVNEAIADLRGCDPSTLRTTAYGLWPHGLTCGVMLDLVAGGDRAT